MMRHLVKCCAVLVCLAVVGCGSSSNTTDAGTGGGSGGGSAGGAAGGRAGGSGGGTGGGSAGGTGGGSAGGSGMGSSCANAIPLTVGGADGAGNIDAAGKKMYFSVPVTQGDFLLITTVANPDDLMDYLDTAVTVYDATGANVLSSIDDAYPRFSSDTELYFRAPATATLCLKLEDWSTWAGMSGVLPGTNDFTLNIVKLTPTNAVVTYDTEPNDTTPQDGRLRGFTQSDGGFTVLVGGLDTASDVDTFKFNVPSGATNMTVFFPPNGDTLGAPGVNSYGSSLKRFTAEVATTTGTVVGRITPPTDVSKMTDSLSISVATQTDYVLSIKRPAGYTPGANEFYATSVEFTTDNPREAETTSGTNDTVGTAEAIALTVDPTDAKLHDGFLLGFLPTGDTADFFSFTAGAGDVVSLGCGSARSGSGLVGFTVDMASSTASLQTETEVATADIYWGTGTTASKGAVTITTAGTYYLKFTKTGQDSTNTGNFYRCGVHLKSP